MKVFVALCALLVVVSSQRPYGAEYKANIDESPKPYSFNYLAEGEEGTSSHEESSDGTGAVRGSYSLTDIDGRKRTVEYVADADGYRASVRTNEPGTDNQSPADVSVESSAPEASPGSAPAVRSRDAVIPRPSGGAHRPGGAVRVGGAAGGVRYVLVPITDPRAEGYY